MRDGITVEGLAGAIARATGMTQGEAEALIGVEIRKLADRYVEGTLTMLDVRATRDYLHRLTRTEDGMDRTETQAAHDAGVAEAAREWDAETAAREHGLGRNVSRPAAEVGYVRIGGDGLSNVIPVQVAAHQRKVIDAARALLAGFEGNPPAPSAWSPEVQALGKAITEYDEALLAHAPKS